VESDTEDRGINKTKDKEFKELYEGDQIRLCIWEQIVKPIVDALGLKVTLIYSYNQQIDLIWLS